MSDFNGMSIERKGEDYAVTRVTREAVIGVTLGRGEYRVPKLDTTILFFDHMLEMLGWYSDLNIDASYEAKTYRLMHVVCEDIGLALGHAARALVVDGITTGIESRGNGFGLMDEARAEAAVSFEGRSNAFLTIDDAARLERVEDMLTIDLAAFFEGFSQGARATVHLRLADGVDPHHAWEAGFRAFGHALRSALLLNPRRAGMTAGVKGTLD
ncbi:MAG TPA: hypothetical protein VMT37_11560 [Solirubrobacterales bacterium]|nr:hypothetical protein [Solirubrobacterales bacterium]